MQNDSPPATKHYYTQYFYKYNFSTASPDLNIRQNLFCFENYWAAVESLLDQYDKEGVRHVAS